MSEINTHGLTVDFGKHKGTLWTRVPVSYLTWLVGAPPPDKPEFLEVFEKRKAIARAELERRGTTIPEIEISGHAIDSASLRVRKIWHQTRRDDSEGIHSWLCRMAVEAKSYGIRDNKHQDKIHYMGIAFVFDQEGEFPIVKTVMRSKVRHEDWPEPESDDDEVLTADPEEVCN